MFGTQYDLNGVPASHDKVARDTWFIASHKFKEGWLRRKGFRVNYSKIPGFLDLPNHVQEAWVEDSKGDE